MVILRQETLFRFSKTQRRFVSCWSILKHESDDAFLCIYKDSTARKLLGDNIALIRMAKSIRFGTPALALVGGSGNELVSRFLGSNSPDARIHRSCLVVIRTERVVKKVKQPHTVWMCTQSVQQLFDLIKTISQCLTSMDVPAPEPNHLNDLNSLHNYRPRAFEPENAWDGFWDNPPNLVPFEQGITISMEALTVQSGSRPGGKNRYNKQKGFYGSTSSLNKPANNDTVSRKSSAFGGSLSRARTIDYPPQCDSDASASRYSTFSRDSGEFYTLRNSLEFPEVVELLKPSVELPQQPMKIRKYTKSSSTAVSAESTPVMKQQKKVTSRTNSAVVPLQNSQSPAESNKSAQIYRYNPHPILKRPSEASDKAQGESLSISSGYSTQLYNNNQPSMVPMDSGTAFLGHQHARKYSDAGVQTELNAHCMDALVPLIAIHSHPHGNSTHTCQDKHGDRLFHQIVSLDSTQTDQIGQNHRMANGSVAVRTVKSPSPTIPQRVSKPLQTLSNVKSTEFNEGTSRDQSDSGTEERGEKETAEESVRYYHVKIEREDGDIEL